MLILGQERPVFFFTISARNEVAFSSRRARRGPYITWPGPGPDTYYPPPTQTQADQATNYPHPAVGAPTFFLKDGKLPLNSDASHYVNYAAQPGVAALQPEQPRHHRGRLRQAQHLRHRHLTLSHPDVRSTHRPRIYSQFGINNLTYDSDHKSGGTPGTGQTGTGGFFLRDAVGEYAVIKNKLSLSAWNGLARYASSSSGTIMGLDLPLVEETTNDVNDQFGRTLSVYAKGKLGKLDYHLAVADPLLYQKAVGYIAIIGTNATFSGRPPKAQYQGYFQYQFKDQESNFTAYAAGTYLGKKTVFNVGAGFIVQPQAVWYRSSATSPDTLAKAMKQFAVDIFCDAPLSTAPDAASVSFYAAAMHLDYGPGYIRNNAPMNPATGTSNAANNIIGGFGNSFPQFGTGNVIYTQLGYKLKDNLVGSSTFMPYFSYQYLRYPCLSDDVTYFDMASTGCCRVIPPSSP